MRKISAIFCSIALSFTIFFVFSAPLSAQTNDFDDSLIDTETYSESDTVSNKNTVDQPAGLQQQNQLNFRQNLEEKKEARKQALEAKREAIKANIETKREANKEKLLQIRDERKQKLLERLDQKLENINTRRTNHFSKVLSRLETLLDKIQSRADKVKSAGQDTTEVETNISNAKAAIVAAQTAVEEQAGKDYVLEIGQESELKSLAGQTISQLQQDLKVVRDLVHSAREAVHTALLSLKNLNKVNNLEESSFDE